MSDQRHHDGRCEAILPHKAVQGRTAAQKLAMPLTLEPAADEGREKHVLQYVEEPCGIGQSTT